MTEKIKAIRDHDKFYLKEDRKTKPKEYFKFINHHIGDFLAGTETMADVGCATGDFLYYMSTLYPQAKLTGIDLMKPLLKHAKREVPDAAYIDGDIYTGRGLPKQKYDAVFLLGVHSIFNDLEPWMNNLAKLTNKDGRIYVFGNFNPEGVDLLVKARYSTLDQKKPWQLGFNLWSKKTLSLFLQKKKMPHRFYDFQIGIDLDRHEDPLRSWTFKLDDGTRALVNGTQIMRNLSLLEIIPHGKNSKK